ncbi:flagellar export chaperone FliS [Bacillus lacus]|uniref:Flagellar secretion chaperone FliS n=1 Tax=Metabacillus lacus TaxID=1983721 RepID=A0A7X2IYL6_9BACI|nr:flagellar export chaperone FliS [Metabacillus lacus]MRX72197.1 flagellar export chaperone FliS [Metabacillus lacus]
MALNNPYQAYQQNSVSTASPGELTLMLYNGCLKFIKQAKLAIQQEQIEERNINILKAQKIVQEFMVTLDMSQDISENMMSMYDYCRTRLIEANIKNDAAILQEVEEHITDFRDAWKQVVQLQRQQQFGQGGSA